MHGKMRNAYKSLIGKSVEKRPLESCRHRWQKPWNHFKMYVEEIYLWGCASEYGGRERKKRLEPSGNVVREEFLHYQGECSSVTTGCSPRSWFQTADILRALFWYHFQNIRNIFHATHIEPTQKHHIWQLWFWFSLVLLVAVVCGNRQGNAHK